MQELLTPTQHTFLESYRLSLQSQRQSELEKRVRQAIEEAEDELPPPRNVVPLLRARWIIGTAWLLVFSISTHSPPSLGSLFA